MSSTPHFTSSANPTLPGSESIKSPPLPFLLSDWNTFALTPLNGLMAINTWQGKASPAPNNIQYRQKLSTSSTYGEWANLPNYANKLPHSGGYPFPSGGTFNVQIRAVVDGRVSVESPERTVTILGLN